ncbi:Carboxylesterase NlhH [Pirellulimonas nuda]|uniref:Carboxylesterase NlhH n=1 Tax=Pirellulimonas nuda TaxID=2528009 RepID=A0A518D7B1_9BACT|nr:alpha/beta hydrolase [Pirellulimonas nuda]QDU87372.1 Carboxylesterase NlhH [Pirellulimonas nuda]
MILQPSFVRRAAAVVLAVYAAASNALAAGPATVTRNLDYIAGAPYAQDRDKLDIYSPTGADGAPVVVYFHGGGLLNGDKQSAAELAARLTAEGVVLVAANYRLSPAYAHPAHIQDAAAAVAWVVANISRYGGDPQRVFVSGHSAGGYLAALLGVDPSYLTAAGVAPQQIRGYAPISPFLYVEETAKVRDSFIWGDDPADWLAASVTPSIGPGKQPMLLVYADGDDVWRRAQNELLESELTEHGNTARAVKILNRNHGSLLSKIAAPDDQIVPLLVDFIHAGD